jgi:hypothetical protein
MMSGGVGDDDVPLVPSPGAAAGDAAPAASSTDADTAPEASAESEHAPTSASDGSHRRSSPNLEVEKVNRAPMQLTEATVRILWEEFKLVQDKIDRIGDFHFRVRTWAITLVSAVVVGGFANKLGWYLYLLSCLPVMSFQLIDRAQTGWQRGLIGRAATLETELRGALQQKGPRIVHAIRAQKSELARPWYGTLVLGNGSVFYAAMYSLLFVATVVTLASRYCLVLWGHDFCIGDA